MNHHLGRAGMRQQKNPRWHCINQTILKGKGTKGSLDLGRRRPNLDRICSDTNHIMCSPGRSTTGEQEKTSPLNKQSRFWKERAQMGRLTSGEGRTLGRNHPPHKNNNMNRTAEMRRLKQSYLCARPSRETKQRAPRKARKRSPAQPAAATALGEGGADAHGGTAAVLRCGPDLGPGRGSLCGGQNSG